MLTIANYFQQYRLAVGWLLVLVTAIAAFGFIAPGRTQHPLEKYEVDLAERQESYTSQVSNRLNLARSDAFLVVECDEFFTGESVAAVRQMVTAVEGLPIIESLFWADRVPMLNVFGFADPLIPAADAPPDSFAAAKEKVTQHPLARQLISDDGNALLMPLVYDWLQLDPAIESQLTERIVQTARDALPTEMQAKIRVRLTGRAPLFAAQQSAFDRNQILFQSIGYVLALILAIIMFRGAAAVAVVSIAPALGVFWALGLVRLIGLPTNPLADIVMPVLVSMIGLTDGVHLLVHIRRRRMAGDEPVEAARSAIEKVGLACWLTSLTTAIGFAALLLASSEYVQDFGRICCVGVFVAFVAVVTFVPFVSSTWLGKYIQHGEERDVVGVGVDSLGKLIDWTLQRRGLVSVLSIAVTIGLLLASMTLRPDNRLASAMPSASEAYQALQFCDEEFGGIEFFRVEMTWPDSIDPDDPKLLAALRDAEAKIEAEPLLGYPLSVRAMLASFPGDPNDLETQVTFLSLLPEELRGFFFSTADRKATISVRMQDRGIAVYTPIFNRLEEGLAQVSTSYPGVQFELAGSPIEISRDLYMIVDDLRTSLGSASVIILIVLAFVYRSVRVGLISVVPNLFPLVATGAWLAWSQGTLDMSGTCAFVVCLGIAVDDTIHFLSRFTQELEVDGDVHAAIRRAFIGVGAPLVMTTIILVTGFGTMLMSELPGHRTFAAMACSTIAAAILGDLLALPSLLSCFFPTKSKSPREGEAPAK